MFLVYSEDYIMAFDVTNFIASREITFNSKVKLASVMVQNDMLFIVRQDNSVYFLFES